MTKIEQIKAEIERRIKAYDDIHEKKELDDLESMYVVELSRELENLLSFIESMEKEQDVDSQLDFKKELHKLIEDNSFFAAADNGTASEMFAKHFYKLGLNAKENTPKIKGWVARDPDGSLTFFSTKPIRFTDCNEGWKVPGACIVCCLGFNSSFPDLKWEDEPIEVELLVKRV